MATVLERFNHLGLAHNNKILMIVGVHISEQFVNQFSVLSDDYRKRIIQIEDENEFDVWDYPEAWYKDMDRLIINFLEHYLDVSQK